jgi:acetyl-CoA acetyltransferase
VATASDGAVIVGIGETELGKLPGWSSVEIQAEATLRALEDAGLTLAEVDGLINLDPYTEPNSMFGVTLADYLGLQPSFVATIDVGGTVTAMMMLQQAAWAIAAGHCTTVVCVFGENMRTGRPPGVSGLLMRNLLGSEEWEDPFGSQGMVIPYALLASRFMAETGATQEDLGAVALSTRAHAVRNPSAQMRTPLTMDDYLSSPMISSPLRRLDCSLVSDGGGAVVLTRASEADPARHRPVRIAGLGMRTTHNGLVGIPDLDQLGMRAAGQAAFAAAGLSCEDVDFLLLHDAFTVSVLIQLEALGFCPTGGSGSLVRSGATGPGGRLPVNPHGGLLSQAHVGGMLHVTEAVRQLRGEAGDRQVEGARHALVSGNGGVFSVCGVMLLEGVPA